MREQRTWVLRTPVDGFAVVSEVAGEGETELEGGSDFGSVEARTAHVAERASKASKTAVNEGRTNLFSVVRFNMVRISLVRLIMVRRSPGKHLQVRRVASGKVRGNNRTVAGAGLGLSSIKRWSRRGGAWCLSVPN